MDNCIRARGPAQVERLLGLVGNVQSIFGSMQAKYWILMTQLVMQHQHSMLKQHRS